MLHYIVLYYIAADRGQPDALIMVAMLQYLSLVPESERANADYTTPLPLIAVGTKPHKGN